MAEPTFEVILLVDRLDAPDDLRTIKGLLERLAAKGHPTQIICVAAAPDHGIGGLIECPGLARRWQVPWATRGLELGDGKGQARLLHVLGSGMADAGLAIAERWRLPYLITIDEFPGPEDRIRLSRSWCRGIVSTNSELAETLRSQYGIPTSLIHEIPRGIPEPSEPIGPSPSGRVPVVGAAGPLVAASGYPVFLNAARKVVDSGIDAEFLIAGEGEDEAELRRRAERLRIADRLTFADDLTVGLTFWDALDVFCQTSVAPTTGRSLDLAMSHGVPSVVSDIEGLRGRIQDGTNGILVPAGDSSALARAIAGLLSDSDRAGRIGEAGRLAVAADHHPDREADLLDGLYHQIVSLGIEPIEILPSQESDPDASRPGDRGLSVPPIVSDA